MVALLTYENHPVTTRPRIFPISGCLWQGNVLAASDMRILEERNIKRIFSIIFDLNVVQPVRAAADTLGISHKIFQIEDCKPFTDHTNFIAGEVLPWIKEGLDSDERTLIHCFAGLSRSSAAVVTTLVWARGMTPPDALELLRERHPVAVPHPDVLHSFLQCVGHQLPDGYLGWIGEQWKRLEESRKNKGRA